MTLTSIPAPVRPSTPSVPGRIRALTCLVALGIAVMFAALVHSGAALGDKKRLVGEEATSGVAAATGLFVELADMDTQLGMVLLQEGDLGSAGYESRRGSVKQAMLDLYRQAESEAERHLVQEILRGVGSYEALAGQALYLSGKAGRGEVVAIYRQATDLMERGILPLVESLAERTAATVTESGRSDIFPIRRSISGVVGGALAALIGLVWLQLFLARSFRRVFSPLLILASVGTALFAFGGVTALDRQADVLVSATEGPFAKTVEVSRSRLGAVRLHAQEVRYLLDPARAGTHQRAFLDTSRGMVGRADVTLEHFQSSLSPLTVNGNRGTGLDTPDARAAREEFVRFQEADQAMRGQARAGKDAAAADLLSGSVRAAYEAFDASLVALTDRHRTDVGDRLAKVAVHSRILWIALPLGVLCLAGLVLAGVFPRLREYR